MIFFSLHKRTLRLKCPPHSVILTYIYAQYRRVSDRRCHDSLSMYYIDKESCHRLSETPPILCVKHVSKLRSKKDFLVLKYVYGEKKKSYKSDSYVYIHK